MIHEVLASDVDFATGMMNSGHHDAEILTCLTSRGLEPAKAAALLQDLHEGRKPAITVTIAPEAGSAPGSQQRRRSGPSAAQKRPAPHHHSHRGRRKRRAATWWFILLVIIFAWAVGYAFLHLGSDASKDVISRSKHEIPPAPGK